MTMKLRRLLFILLTAASVPLFAQYPNGSYDPYDDYPQDFQTNDAIQIALILDVSGSMEGLLEQAKSQLWHIVNGINWAYDGGYAPRLELALYVYGEQNGSYRQGYVRQVVPFTADLDWVADALWGVRTGGRYEFAGAAIQATVTELRWSFRASDRKMIYIAGNEVFNQGPVDSRDALYQANRRGITVNTIYCGEDYKGRRQGWDDAAHIGGGTYMAINHNYRERYDYYRPYNDRLLGLNQRLNATYIPYGYRARTFRDRQIEQDRRARRLGYGIYCERVIVKSSRAYYQPDWDLVDAYYLGVIRLEDISMNDLPPEMRGMSRSEQRAFLSRKARERQQIRSEIRGVAGEVRQSQTLSAGSTRPDRTIPSTTRPSAQRPATLDQAIIESIQQEGPRQRVNPVERELPRTRPEAAPRRNSTVERVPSRETNPSYERMSRERYPSRSTPSRQTRELEVAPRRTVTPSTNEREMRDRSRTSHTTRPVTPMRQAERVQPHRSTPTAQGQRQTEVIRQQPRTPAPRRSAPSVRTTSPSRQVERTPPRRSSSQEAVTPRRQQSTTPAARTQTQRTPTRTAPATSPRREVTPSRSTPRTPVEVKPRSGRTIPTTSTSRTGGNNQ